MLHVVRLCPHISAVCTNNVTERHSSIQLITTAASIHESKIPLVCSPNDCLVQSSTTSAKFTNVHM